MLSSATRDSAPIGPGTKQNYNFARFLAERAQLHPEKNAIVRSTGTRRNGRAVYDHLTFAELDRLSDRYARGLERSGIRRGVKTVLMAKPDMDFFPLVIALFKIGAVPVIVDPGMGIGRMLHCIRSTDPGAFIGIPIAHVIRLLAPWYFRTVRCRVTVGRRLFWGGATTLSMKKDGDARYAGAVSAQDELAAIIFTTGSTGPAKGVEYTHGMFDTMVSLLAENFNLGSDEVDLATFPLYTLFDVSLGITAVLPDMDPASPASADPEKIVEAITDYQATNMFASPALLKNLSEHCGRSDIRLASIRRIISGGAPVSPRLMEQTRLSLVPGAELFATYGATEAPAMSSIRSMDVLSETRHATDKGRGTCIGRPFSGIEAAIIAITDGPCETLRTDLLARPGEVGEIIVKGTIVSKKYFKLPGENLLSKISDAGSQWHRTGDLGWLDGQGRIWFCGRKKQRVATAEREYYTIPCEAIFNTHPAVARSALVGASSGSEAIPVICVELHPANRKSKKIIEKELRILARRHDVTRGIDNFMFNASFPVDIRHNSKIAREKLARWASGKLH